MKQSQPSNPSNLQQLYAQSDNLFLQLSAYFKKLLHDHNKTTSYSIQQKKILKLFSYNAWQQYIRWVDQKLEQSQSNTQSNKLSLPEIVEEEAELQDSIYNQVNNNKSSRCEILAIENAKLRKENIIIVDKIEKIEREIKNISSNKNSQ